MFETNLDEYLDEEVETLKQAFEVICKDWDRQVDFPLCTRVALLTIVLRSKLWLLVVPLVS